MTTSRRQGPDRAVNETFLVVARKARGADRLRAAARVEHLEFMIRHRDRVRWGGSFQNSDGTWGGMALVVHAPTIAAARYWLDGEPYCSAGLFATIDVTAFRQLIPEPVDGLLLGELEQERLARGRAPTIEP